MKTMSRDLLVQVAYSSIVLTFIGSEEIDCYRGDVVSAGQLGATTARTNHYFAGFFLFLSWEV